MAFAAAAPGATIRENASRRSTPRVFDTDWLVLKDLRRAIETAADQMIRPGMCAIDLGCGSQPYRELVERRGATYRGADYGSGHDFEISPAGRVDAPDGGADVVLSFQVLEHVRDLDLYLGEVHRLLKPGGELLLSTHGTWLYHPHPEDHRRWTRQGLVTDLEMRGFEVLDCVPVVGPLAWTLMIRLTSFAFVLRKIPLIGGLLAGAAAIAYNLRALAEDKVTPQWVRAENACVYLVRARPVATVGRPSNEEVTP